MHQVVQYTDRGAIVLSYYQQQKTHLTHRKPILPFFGLSRCGKKLLTAMGSAKTRELRSLGTRRTAISSSGRLWTRSSRNLLIKKISMLYKTAFNHTKHRKRGYLYQIQSLRRTYGEGKVCYIKKKRLIAKEKKNKNSLEEFILLLFRLQGQALKKILHLKKVIPI